MHIPDISALVERGGGAGRGSGNPGIAGRTGSSGLTGVAARREREEARRKAKCLISSCHFLHLFLVRFCRTYL